MHYGKPTPKKILDLSLLWEEVLCFGFDLAKLFIQGAPLQQIFCHCGKWHYAYASNFQGISSRYLHATLKRNFLNCHYFGNGALCFGFDLTREFPQGATMPPLLKFFFPLPLLWGGIMLLLRLIQGIFLGCHHATITIFFGIVIVVKGHYASSST